MKNLLYFAALCSFFGGKFLFINAGIAQISMLRLVLILVVLLFILKAIAGIKPYHFIRIEHSIKYFVIFLLYWLGYALISLAWAVDHIAWLKQVFFITSGFIEVILITTIANKAKDIWNLFKMMQIGILIQVLIGVNEIITGKYLFLESIRALGYSKYTLPVAMMGNTNGFATCMIIGVGISFVGTKTWNSRIFRLLSWLMILTCSVLIFYSQSRANVIGLLLMVGFYMFSSGKGFWATILVLLGLFLVIPDFSGFLGESINVKFNLEGKGSAGIRLNLIRNSIDFLFRSFGFGIGAGQAEEWMTRYAIHPVGLITSPHNWWIEILVNYGVIVFLSYLVFYIKLFVANFKIQFKTNSKIDSHVSQAICMMMIGYLIGSISSSSNMGSEWLWLFWAVVIGWIRIALPKTRYIENEELTWRHNG